MRIQHVAIWTRDIEKLKNFYVKYFNGIAGEKYINNKKQFQSYFISFESGARLELMQKADIEDNRQDCSNQCIGLAHIAFSVGSKEAVDRHTDTLRNAGYAVISGPRTTGDGCYESCILDPDGNQIEITI